jgi:amino acid transporter
MSLLLAATTLEKLQDVPMKVWVNFGMFIFIFIAAIFIIRKAAEMNKVVLSVIIFVVISCVGLNWVYARNEPKFLTPIIEPLANFFPTAGKQAEKEKRSVIP